MVLISGVLMAVIVAPMNNEQVSYWSLDWGRHAGKFWLNCLSPHKTNRSEDSYLFVTTAPNLPLFVLEWQHIHTWECRRCFGKLKRIIQRSEFTCHSKHMKFIGLIFILFGNTFGMFHAIFSTTAGQLLYLSLHILLQFSYSSLLNDALMEPAG